MSIPTFLLPRGFGVPLYRSAHLAVATRASCRSCIHSPARRIPSYPSRASEHSYSTKRRLQTSTSYRPSTLDVEPPPRNHDVPPSSIANPLPQPNETRPPDLATSNIAVTEGEAQKPSPKHITDPASKSRDSTATPTTARKSRLRPRKSALTLTPAAVAHLKELLTEPTPQIIRVGVKNRGCSGLAYHLEYVEKPGPFDETVDQDGVKVLIDSKALFSIIGSEMDWLEDKLNERFIFRNPNIKEQCGCGESFMV